MKQTNSQAVPDIAAEAEAVITSLMEEDRYHQLQLKTSQIRKFLAAVTAVTNKIDVWHMSHLDTNVLPEDLAAEVKYLKVKLAYQAGRERSVREFGEKADLTNRINKIGRDLKKYQDFAHFVEALVAYHKFYGGKEA